MLSVCSVVNKLSPYRREIIALVFVLVLGIIFFAPYVGAGWANNQAGLQALAACTGQGDAGAAPADAWFAAAATRCRAGAEAARSQYAVLLIQPGAPVELVRGFYPDDEDLAGLAVRHQGTAPAYFWLADLLRSTSPAEARVLYEAGLALAPRDALRWDRLGRLYEGEDRLVEAAHAYELACRYMDAGKNGCLNAGRVYLALGRYADALQAYEQSLRQLPGYAPALNGLRAAQAGLGE